MFEMLLKRKIMGQCNDNSQLALRIHIKNSEPIQVSDFTASMNAIGSYFSSFAQKNGMSKELSNAKLCVSKITEGSIDIHLVELVSLSMIPFVENFNLIMEFAKNLKNVYDYFTSSSGEKPELTAKELQDLHDILSIPSKDQCGQMDIQVIKGDVNNVVYTGCTFNYIESNGTQNLIDKEIEIVKSVSEQDEIHTNQLMTMYQIRGINSNSGNKGIIEALNKKALNLLFESDGIRDQIINSKNNPLKKVFAVDVVIQNMNNKPFAYKIVKLLDVFDIED